MAYYDEDEVQGCCHLWLKGETLGGLIAEFAFDTR